MSTELVTTDDARALNLEKVLVSGDLNALTPPERLSYIKNICASLGLNPLTRPFEYQTFQGRCILYARKDCTEQLRKIHRVSVTELRSEVVGDLLRVTAYGEDRTGKKDLATGVVSIAGLRGESLANAHMKAETKAKRRFTLSICGLGILDETEIEAIVEAVPTKAAQVNALLAEPTSSVVSVMEEEPDFVTEAAASAPDFGDYVIPIGERYKNKKLKDLSPSTLRQYVAWVEDKVPNKTDLTNEFLANASSYLESLKGN